jgi:hypothetical protein
VVRVAAVDARTGALQPLPWFTRCGGGSAADDDARIGIAPAAEPHAAPAAHQAADGPAAAAPPTPGAA